MRSRIMWKVIVQFLQLSLQRQNSEQGVLRMYLHVCFFWVKTRAFSSQHQYTTAIPVLHLSMLSLRNSDITQTFSGGSLTLLAPIHYVPYICILLQFCNLTDRWNFPRLWYTSVNVENFTFTFLKRIAVKSNKHRIGTSFTRHRVMYQKCDISALLKYLWNVTIKIHPWDVAKWRSTFHGLQLNSPGKNERNRISKQKW